MTEVFNVFARFFFRDKKIKDAKLYTKWRSDFIQTIHDRNIIYCYDLHRYHNLNAHKVYGLEHKTPYARGEKPLYAPDILVIAMGMELKKIHTPSLVTILTRDCRLKRISNMDKSFAAAEWFE